MTTQTYIPSEEELKEMGFSGNRHWYEYLIENRFEPFNWATYIRCNKNQFWIYIHNESNYDDSIMIDIFPKDRAHLQSIILAFQPK